VSVHYETHVADDNSTKPADVMAYLKAQIGDNGDFTTDNWRGVIALFFFTTVDKQLNSMRVVMA
jgi:hypothetical protein